MFYVENVCRRPNRQCHTHFHKSNTMPCHNWRHETPKIVIAQTHRHTVISLLPHGGPAFIAYRNQAISAHFLGLMFSTTRNIFGATQHFHVHTFCANAHQHATPRPSDLHQKFCDLMLLTFSCNTVSYILLRLNIFSAFYVSSLACKSSSSAN